MGGMALAHAAKSALMLQRLNVSHNALTGVAGMALAEAVRVNHGALTCLASPGLTWPTLPAAPDVLLVAGPGVPACLPAGYETPCVPDTHACFCSSKASTACDALGPGHVKLFAIAV